MQLVVVDDRITHGIYQMRRRPWNLFGLMVESTILPHLHFILMNNVYSGPSTYIDYLEWPAVALDLQAEEVLDLGGHDVHRGAGGET